ncbi:MAG: sugar transferase [Actinomycetota bacterium]|nr:sugar transferase [Actinomycetota bacterium]
MTMTLERPFRRDTAPAPVLEPVGASRPRGAGHRAALISTVLAIVFQPILHPSGPGNSSPVDIFTLATIVTTGIWVTSSRHRIRAPYVIPVGLMVAAGAASGAISLLPTLALTTLAVDILLFLWCTSLVNVLSTPRALSIALTAWSWAGIGWAIIVVLAWLGHVTAIEGLIPADGNRVLFTFGDPNYASTYWLSTLFITAGARTPRKTWMRIAGYVLLLWALALTESNGGMLSLAVGVFFLVLVKSYRFRGLAGIAATALGVCTAVATFLIVFPLSTIRQWALNSGQTLLVNSIGRSAQSGSERLTLIKELWELYRRSSAVLGLGPGSTKPLLTTWLYPYANMAHNDYLAMLTERGPIALLGLLLLISTAIFWAFPLLKRPLSARFAAAVPVPSAVVAGLLALGINSFYEEILHFRFLWALLAIVAVLGRDARRRVPTVRGQAGRAAGFAVASPQPGPADTGPGPAAPGRAGWLVRPSRADVRRGALTVPGSVHGPHPRQPRVLVASPDAVVDRAPAPARRPPRHPARRQTDPGPGPGGGLISRESVSNLLAQGAALAAVSLASLLVARAGGPLIVGEYALLRVLPWLFGVVFSLGLPTASAFFLAGQHRLDRRLRPTIVAMALAGVVAGVAAWLACAAAFHAIFFGHMALSLVIVMAAAVATQLCTVTAKACCQGSGDIAGANLVIVAEELWFVACYPVVLFAGLADGVRALVLAMLVSGVLATATGLVRLARRGFFADFGTPSFALARKIAAFGARGQLGNLLWLMNLRFDFVLLGAIAGPATLGIYAVASKFAELMRLAPTAINYVLYPRLARLGRGQATAQARRLLPRATALTLVLAPILGVATYLLLPELYGSDFAGAVVPAGIIIIGLSVEGAAAVSSAYLVGTGRPGVNSAAMGLGAAITVALDLMLIPRYGAIGGAITSAVTYLATTATLTVAASLLGRPDLRRHAEFGPDSRARRVVDVAIAATALVLTSPLLLLIAAAVKVSSRGPVLYRQVRVGRGGGLFTLVKFRSMTIGADATGPLVTTVADPRITRIGGLLRSTKLDELPQLWNVLTGDMTLIGPRPEVPRFIPWYEESELALLRVRPGLTGPGQIVYTDGQPDTTVTSGDDDVRGVELHGPEAHYITTELHPKLAIDLDYLRSRSLGRDMFILARTVALILAAILAAIRVAARRLREGTPAITAAATDPQAGRAIPDADQP